jgi:hypothetical protein
VEEVNKEYEMTVKKIDQLQKSVPHNRLVPLNNLIRVKELQDENGFMYLKFGVCEKEVLGERHSIKDSLKTKVSILNLW